VKTKHPQLFPYHLSDVICRQMRLIPFNYYLEMMVDLMMSERSYDSLPNFTAKDGENFFFFFAGIPLRRVPVRRLCFFFPLHILHLKMKCHGWFPDSSPYSPVFFPFFWGLIQVFGCSESAGTSTLTR
jgi:hypothetical protein